MNFLRNLLATIIGVFIAIFLIFFVFIAIGSAFAGSEKITVKNNSVLILNFEDEIRDYYSVTDPFADALGLDDTEILSLNKILNAIENAKDDDNIEGISIETKYVNAGFAQMLAIRNKLIDFKLSGKFITAYADAYSQKNYYLSSVADSLFINPLGYIEFKGLSAEILYYKDFQEKYGIKMEVIRHGKYKSAVEPYLSNTMSVANREQITSFLQSIWQTMLTDIAASRNKSTAELNAIADDLLARNVNLAKKNNMIDAVMYYDTYVSKLKQATGKSDSDKLTSIDIADYINSGKGRIFSTAKDKIDVIYAHVEIRYGEGNENYIVPKTMIIDLKKARNNQRIKAIVLRINSTGDDVLASVFIWSEFDLPKK